MTNNGNLCQRWSSQKPHKHVQTPKKFPYDGLDSNFCRNPNKAKSIWCYTTNPDKRWEYCDELDQSDPEGLWGYKGTQYRGNQNVTRNGYNC